VSTVPPAQIRGGNFNFVPAGERTPILAFDQLTSVPCTNPGVACTSGGVYVRQPFPGNVLPASRISAVGRAIVNLFPTPNFDPTSLTQNYLRADNTGRYRYEQPMARWITSFPITTGSRSCSSSSTARSSAIRTVSSRRHRPAT